jgi:putative holliday junction resolvase
MHKIGFIDRMNFNETDLGKHFQGRTILAIDYGRKFTGLAMFRPGSDLDPYPYDRLAYKNDEALISDIKALISNEFIEVIVLGVPYLTDGGSTNMTKIMLKFGDILKKGLSPSIELFSQDETLSSFEAKDRMKNSARYNFKIDMKKIDQVAASIILEDFLKLDIEKLNLKKIL